jgi:hypothetical protein
MRGEVADDEVAGLELVEGRSDLVARGRRFASAPPPDQSSSHSHPSVQMLLSLIGRSYNRGQSSAKAARTALAWTAA